jgi:hypothetical protein
MILIIFYCLFFSFCYKAQLQPSTAYLIPSRVPSSITGFLPLNYHTLEGLVEPSDSSFTSHFPLIIASYPQLAVGDGGPVVHVPLYPGCGV